MKIKVFQTPEELGRSAADYCADILRQAITDQGHARLLLSTGASQFETLKALVQLNVDWNKVEAFHLDEYINLPPSHPASFRKYLQERFVDSIPLKKMHFVKTEGDIQENIEQLSAEIRRQPIDLALIGIGENAHIAFNDPPADFDTRAAYLVVDLDNECKKQQVGEGWFATVDDVPKQAITMSVYQILQSKVIVSCVPYHAKAQAIKLVLDNDVTNRIPGTALKNHSHCTLFLDRDSASLIDPLPYDL